jgi:predicted dithiol-disulfide oxidoreductase (DUF899 family)
MPKIVSHEEWLAARTAFLTKEKEFTRARDELAAARRALPWERVEKRYEFETPSGKQTLADLFGAHGQLAVYHFMFAPDWEAGCPHCSFWADSFDRAGAHLAQRDTSFLAISRAPLAKLQAFQQRMGWGFRWVSSGDGDFNYDFQASFRQTGGPVYYNYVTEEMDMTDREGMSFFIRDGGQIFHTYSTYARGIDLVNSAYNILDLTAKGRHENPEHTQDWVKHHDKY